MKLVNPIHKQHVNALRRQKRMRGIYNMRKSVLSRHGLSVKGSRALVKRLPGTEDKVGQGIFCSNSRAAY
jgi:hypothetical protein